MGASHGSSSSRSRRREKKSCLSVRTCSGLFASFPLEVKFSHWDQLSGGPPAAEEECLLMEFMHFTRQEMPCLALNLSEGRTFLRAKYFVLKPCSAPPHGLQNPWLPRARIKGFGFLNRTLGKWGAAAAPPLCKLPTPGPHPRCRARARGALPLWGGRCLA